MFLAVSRFDSAMAKSFCSVINWATNLPSRYSETARPALARSALERSDADLDHSAYFVRSAICSSMNSVSNLTSSSPDSTWVPLSTTQMTVFWPRTMHLISVLSELSNVPCSVTVTSRSPRAIVCVSLRPVPRDDVAPGINATVQATAVTTPITSRPRFHHRPCGEF